MSSTSDGEGISTGGSTTTPAAFGGDELARLKRQVAALKVTTPVVDTRGIDDSPPTRREHQNKKKNKALFGYWQGTSATEGQSAPPAIHAAAKKYEPSSTNHNFTPPTTTFALPPPLGRPPSSYGGKGGSGGGGAEFKPTAAQYNYNVDDNNNNDSSTDDGGSSSSKGGNVSMIPRHRGGKGEKWDPSADIRQGSVAKFSQMFGTKDKQPPNNNNNNDVDSASSCTASPPKGPRGTSWNPPPKPAESPKNRGGQHGEKWAPRDEIDSNRIDSIKALWGAKTTAANAKVVVPTTLPYRRASLTVENPPSAALVKESEDFAADVHGSRAGHISPPMKEPDESTTTERTITDDTTGTDDDLDDELAQAITDDDELDDEEFLSRFGGGSDDEMDVLHSPDEGESVATPSVGNDDDAMYDAASDGGGESLHDEAIDDDESSEPISLEQKLMVWEEIMELVRDVLPGEVDNVDDLLAQFNGRESKLRDALKGMQERSISITSSSGHDDDDEEEEVEVIEEEDADQDMDVEEVDDNYMHGEYTVPLASPDASVVAGSVGREGGRRTADDEGSLTTHSSDRAGKGDVQFDYANNEQSDIRYAEMNRIVSDAISSSSPDDFLDDNDAEVDIDGANGRVTKGVMLPNMDSAANDGTRRAGDGSSARSGQDSAQTVPETPPASSRAMSATDNKIVTPVPFAIPTDRQDDGTTHSSGIHGGSLEDGAIESEESRHVSFVDVTGLAEGIRPQDRLSVESSQKSTDKFTGQNYYYSTPSRGTPAPPPSEKDDDTAKTHNQGPKGDVEGGLQRISKLSEGPPLVNGRDISADGSTKEDFHASFETVSIGSAVPSIGVPTSVGLLKNGARAPSVVSSIPEPRMSNASAHHRPTPWYEKRRTKCYVCVVLVLLAACGAVMGLFFSGILLGDDGGDGGGVSEINKSDMSVAVLPETVALVVVPTDPPSWKPSSSPSESPSAAPVTSCTESIRSQYSTLGVGNSPGEQAPNIAMDGTNAVVVNRSGGVRFYSLVNSDGTGEWVEVDYFPNLNRYPVTPHVAISGNVAVVGFVYQVLGFDIGTGGAYVYEQDTATGRWKREDVLKPEPGDNIDNSAKFGWSVDVDADQKEPLIVVGAYGENDKAGSVYVFQRIRLRQRTYWSRVGKVLPKFCPSGDFEFNFGYSVAVSGNVIAASTDCDFIVQLSSYNGTLNGIETYQNIRYIDFKLGAISTIIMDERYLAYSTVFGGVAIYERTMGSNDTDYEFLEQLDFSGNEKILHYPLAIDRDILVVGVGNDYWIFPKKDSLWKDGAFFIQNGDVDAFDIPSVAVSGRNVLAGSGNPHEVYHYDITNCAHAMPTQTPTWSSAPTPFTTWPPSLKPTTDKPTISPTTERPSTSPTRSNVPTPSTPIPTATLSLRPSTSSAPTPNPTISPTLRPTDSPSVSPVASSLSPSLSPIKNPTQSPSAPPTQQAISSSSTVTPALSCYPLEISILYDSSPFGVGYVLTKVDTTGAQSNIDTFFAPFVSELANQLSTKSLCLEEGSYKFTMYDSYGDGLCCVNGNGGYVIKSNGVTLGQGGEFRYNDERLFELPASV